MTLSSRTGERPDGRQDTSETDGLRQKRAYVPGIRLPSSASDAVPPLSEDGHGAPDQADAAIRGLI